MADTTGEGRIGPAPASEPVMVDWELAIGTARRLAKPAPSITRDEADRVVGELRERAAAAEQHVRGFTGLRAASGTSPVLVVDRNGWVRANVEALQVMTGPVVRRLSTLSRPPSAITVAVGARVTAVEAGGLLAFLSSRVLGQFDPFSTGADGSATSGRLLLVAPNIVQVERELGVDSSDFRLWVCLHEETHRVQFGAVPWLREHMLAQIEALVDATAIDPAKVAELKRQALERLRGMLRGDTDVSLMELFQTPEQRAIVDHLTAVMSLLEGHADVVMDGVGPAVVPSVEKIRSKFQERRSKGGLEHILRRLLGFDAKLRQYRDGAVFVRGVIAEVGMDGFNAVWERPEHLPSKDEIASPSAWVARVHRAAVSG